MATIYSLFLGILSFSLCFSTAVKNAVLNSRTIGSESIFSASDHLSRQVDGRELSAKIAIRDRLIQIAVAELGVREEGGENQGQRVGEYLGYVGLGAGYEWCAAFASWCYGQAGLLAPRSAWSPALFPKARRYAAPDIRRGRFERADLFAIYSSQLRRIHHVGLVEAVNGGLMISVEGNSHDRVESRRRPLSTIYAMANWVD
ncbi:CHAP domain-containing protein [Sphingobacterium sp. DR205]|uniref:CHAP domain-containing protein n=1 Tax=Sphingobacterium sp. DR205 TaxID=2713573 RepID=UPI0013E4CCC2|nr:CHAP domain-containing protein [Sphingobacterium sp. DR205]QIH35487.1 CHAP domain-containing protein [Sphingobacterium sp. DR205]